MALLGPSGLGQRRDRLGADDRGESEGDGDVVLQPRARPRRLDDRGLPEDGCSLGAVGSAGGAVAGGDAVAEDDGAAEDGDALGGEACEDVLAVDECAGEDSGRLGDQAALDQGAGDGDAGQCGGGLGDEAGVLDDALDERRGEDGGGLEDQSGRECLACGGGAGQGAVGLGDQSGIDCDPSSRARRIVRRDPSGGEGRTVDRHLVDPAIELLSGPGRCNAEVLDARRVAPDRRPRCDLHAIDVDPQRRPVERERHLVSRTDGKSGRTRDRQLRGPGSVRDEHLRHACVQAEPEAALGDRC